MKAVPPAMIVGVDVLAHTPTPMLDTRSSVVPMDRLNPRRTAWACRTP